MDKFVYNYSCFIGTYPYAGEATYPYAGEALILKESVVDHDGKERSGGFKVPIYYKDIDKVIDALIEYKLKAIIHTET